MSNELSKDRKQSLESLQASEDEQKRLMKAHQDWVVQQSSDGPTERLHRDGATPLPGSVPTPLFFGGSSADVYLPLPSSYERRHPDRICWRIELHGLPGGKPIGLDILGDVVIGRGANFAKAPDLDLTPYGALDSGVSRHHVVLKPTPQSLYLLDLNSMNGTQYNGMPVKPGMARSLMNNDVIMLGTLRFQVRIVESPAMRRANGY